MSQNHLVAAAREAMEDLLDQYDVAPPRHEQYIQEYGDGDGVCMVVDGEETSYTVSAWDEEDAEAVYVLGRSFVDYDVGFPDANIRVWTSHDPLELHSTADVREAIEAVYQAVSAMNEDDLQNEEMSWSERTGDWP